MSTSNRVQNDLYVSSEETLDGLSVAYDLVQSDTLRPSEGTQTPFWMLVQVFGWSQRQVVPIGTRAPTPSQSSIINSDASRRNVALRGQLRVDNDVIPFDIGTGIRSAIYATRVTVQVLAPLVSVQIREPAAPGVAPRTTPETLNTVVFGDISFCNGAIGERRMKHTIQGVADGITPFLLPVPARADWVTVYDTTLAFAPYAFETDSGVVLGIVAPTNIGFRVRIPRGATRMNFGLVARTISAVFDLEV